MLKGRDSPPSLRDQWLNQLALLLDMCMLLRLLILRQNQSKTGTSIYHNASFASYAYSGAATHACGYGSESTSPEELQKYIQGQMVCVLWQ